MKTVPLLFSLFFLLVLVSKTSSECVPACSSYGTCETRNALNETTGATDTQYYCFCTTLWEGPTCEIRWRDDSGWMKFVTAYQVCTVLMFTGLLMWSLYESYLIFFKGPPEVSKFTIVSYAIVLIAVGALLRVILFVIDPHSIRDIIPIPAYQIMISLPIIAWLSGGFGICIFWMELNKNLGVNKIDFIKSFRPFLWFLVGLTWCLLIPASIYLSLKNDTPGLFFYNISVVLLFFIFLIITTVFGYKLTQQLKKSGGSSAKRFLSRITRYMVCVSIALVISSITAILFVFFANYSKYPYIIIHFFLRVEEMAVTGLTMILFTRRAPKSSKSKEITAESGTTETPSLYKISVQSTSNESNEVAADSMEESTLDLEKGDS